MADGNFALAQQLVSELAEEPREDWLKSRFIIAEAATKLGNTEQAVAAYRQVIANTADSAQKSEALFFLGEMYRGSGQLSAAIESYRGVLEIKPDNVATHERLAFLLSACGDSWGSVEHYVKLVKSGTATTAELVLFADRDRAVEQLPFLQECERQAPGDLAVRQGLAAHAFWEGERAKAEELLREVTKAAPQQLSARAMRGELLVDCSGSEFAEWHAGLPPDAYRHPDVWYVRGLWARRQQALNEAAFCFLRSITLDSCHRRATYQLSQVLATLQHPSAQAVAERAAAMIQLTESLDDVLEHQRSEEYRTTAQTLLRLGRYWEACAWGVEARNLYPEAPWPSDLFANFTQLLTDDLPLTAREFDPVHREDLHFTDSGLSKLFDSPGQLTPSADAQFGSGRIRFVAQPVHPEFRYFASADEATPGARTMEVNGGGVAVLDYNLDGRSDVFFSQGIRWESGADVPAKDDSHHDVLNRNHGTFMTRDVTAYSLPADTGYGQGCTVSDYDNDGFPDLYVANVGRNQLLRNMGDGTFEDVTEAAGITAREWTASTLAADLNGDSFPDLFDVNYLRGDNVYTAICDRRSCSPANFEGTPDRLWVSQGNGTFVSIDGATPQQDAKGLGVVLVPTNDPRRPSIFVANDQVANFLLRNEPADNPSRIRLTNEAFGAGVAFNQDGLAMAGMGVAIDDINGGGLLDLFVTNFSDEANTLFLQDSPGLYLDASNQSELKAASIPFVGWGTQFLDANLDGWSDLVLVNGNVDDRRDDGGEYHMRPQFFRNLGLGRFQELFGDEIGEYFSAKWLGRGLARLDFNQDGLMDFVVNNIEQPAQLVLNQTQSAGRYLNFKLHASQSARDAIGTRITLSTNDSQIVKYLLAGDGYMASNERLVQFGLGPADRAVTVKVEWPSGTVTQLHDLAADGTLELTEGRVEGIWWQGGTPHSWRLDRQDDQELSQ